MTHPVGPTLSLRNSRVEYIKTRPSNTLITYASYGNELSWTVEDCCCLWQLIIWPIDQNCSTHHRALCPLHLPDHHTLYLSGWGGGGCKCAYICMCVCLDMAVSWLLVECTGLCVCEWQDVVVGRMDK